jgi:hypothetical protein
MRPVETVLLAENSFFLKKRQHFHMKIASCSINEETRWRVSNLELDEEIPAGEHVGSTTSSRR